MDQTRNVFVGTYTTRGSEGIHVLRFDPVSGALERTGAFAAVPNPTFVVLHPKCPVLYAVSEVRDAAGPHGGSVHAFHVDCSGGELAPLNMAVTNGAGPCHLSIDRSGAFLFAANYHSGSVAMFPLNPDGRLGEACDLVQHEGIGTDPERQEGPHAHSATLVPDEGLLIVADLGLDRLVLYEIDRRRGRLDPHKPAYVSVAPGAGPRHLAFHPDGHWAYVVHELNNTVTVLRYDAAGASFKEFQTVSTLPDDCVVTSYAAHVAVAPSGRFLYASNRGHDSIAVFAIDRETGALVALGHDSSQGRWPRHFAVDPNGRWLLAANQESDTVTVLRIAPDSGRLLATGCSVSVSMPVCVCVVPVTDV